MMQIICECDVRGELIHVMLQDYSFNVTQEFAHYV